MRRILFLLVPLSLILVACGGDDDAATGATPDAHGGGHDENSEAAEDARTLEIVATSFEFDPATIEAAPDEDLAIELTARDAEHDFVIDELDAHVGAESGETGTGGFNTGHQRRSYTFYCSIPGHRDAGMEGTLVVR